MTPGVLIMLAGAGLIALSFVFERGQRTALGVGLKQTLSLAAGGGISLLGASWLFGSRRTSYDVIAKTASACVSSVRHNLRDCGIAFGLFCAGLVIGSLYVFMVHRTGVASFYAATAPVRQSRLFGGIVFPYGVLFGAVGGLSYGIFRLGMGRTLSAICALAFMMSPNHLHNLVPSVMRDYIKAPLILCVVLIMGVLVVSPWSRGRLLTLSATCGMIIGVGLWFRQDLIVVSVPFVAVLFFFLPGPLLGNLNAKFASLALWMAAILLFSWPVLHLGFSSGPHRVLGGFMTPLDGRLDVTRPVYDWGYLFQDEFVWGMAYAQATTLSSRGVYSFSREEYDRLGSEYVRKIIRNFPADMLTRTYAAVLKVVELPFSYSEPPLGVRGGLVGRLYDLRGFVVNVLAGSGLLLSVGALLVISAHSLREAWFFLFFLLYFGGYPVLQFQGRHYFHLECITWWSFGFLVQRGLAALRGIVSWGLSRTGVWPVTEGPFGSAGGCRLRRVVVFTVSSLVLLLVPLLALRHYQSWHVRNLLQEYAAAERQRLPRVEVPLGNSNVLVMSPGEFVPMSQHAVGVEFLLMEFSPRDCDYSTVWPILRYAREPGSGRPGFSRTLSVDIGRRQQRVTQLVFPAISYNDGQESVHFTGLELTKAQARCLRGMYRITNTRKFPLLLTAVIPPATGRSPLYQTIGVLEATGVYTVPRNMPSSVIAAVLARPVTTPRRSEVDVLSDIAHIDGDQWGIRGYAIPQSDPYNFPARDRSHSLLASAFHADVSVGVVDTDLLKTKEVHLSRKSYFVAQGVMYAGGATLGLIKDGRTAGDISISSRGPFTVVIEVPEDGDFSLGISNDLDGYTSLENRFIVRRVGWVNVLQN